MKDVPSVAPAPTPEKKTPFQEKPSREEVKVEQIEKELLQGLINLSGDYPEGFHLEEMVNDDDLKFKIEGMKGENSKFTEADFDGLIGRDVLNYNATTDTYHINFASPEVYSVMDVNIVA